MRIADGIGDPFAVNRPVGVIFSGNALIIIWVELVVDGDKI